MADLTHGCPVEAGEPRSLYCHGRRRPTIVRVQARLVREVEVLSRHTQVPVINRNCVAVRWGGEQREVKGSSVA
jgi:hypothetical protein